MSTLRTILLLTLMMAFEACVDAVPTNPGGPEFSTNDQLLPLHTGNSWKYDMSGEASIIPDDYFTITQPLTFEPFKVYEMVNGGYLAAESAYLDRATYHLWTTNPVSVHYGYFNEPCEYGFAIGRLPRNPWINGEYDGLVCESIDTVAVPAGRFACYRFSDTTSRETSGDRRTWWFSRGVGMIRKVLVRNGSEVARWELREYHVHP